MPHFTTLAKVVSCHTNKIEELFEQVLLGNETLTDIVKELKLTAEQQNRDNRLADGCNRIF